MAEKRINIFIPHYGKDEEHIPRLIKMLESKNYVVRDSSIVETEPNNAKNIEYIKSLLRPKINWAGTIIVLIGPKTHERDWVNWEIEHAFENNKRIVGVFIQGATDSDLPDNFKDYGDACVAWNSDKLEAAIEGENIWHDSTGNDRSNDGTGRVTC
ncbi:hypothetical protein D3C81_1598730 [compost metagenome]